jgi:hypothetical protein
VDSRQKHLSDNGVNQELPNRANDCISRAFSFKLPFMRRLFLSLMLCGVGLSIFVGPGQTQSPAGSDTPQRGVWVMKVYDPVYPQLVHTANVHGDVELLLKIRQDGAIQSVAVVSGPPLLQQVAVESARQSQFECRACTEGVTPYKLVYSFQLSEGDCCNSPNSPKVTASENRVLVTNSHFCFCDPAGTVGRKVRSMKCLYLWRCSVR